MLALWLGIASPALAGGPFVINGKLAEASDGAVVRLFRPDGSMGAAVAADTVHGGRFVLRGEAEQLEMLSIAVQGEGFPSMELNVWVEPDAVVSVSGRDKLLATWKVTSKIPQQTEANRYIDASRSEYIQMQQAAVEFSALPREADRTQRSRLLKRMDSLQMLIRKAEIGILQQTPVSEVWLDKLRNQAVAARVMKDYPYRAEVLALYEKLPQQQRETSRGRSIRLNLFPPPVAQPGDEMADADLLDTLGRVHRLADYKGKYLLLDFWSIGCGPCKLAMPEMKRMGEAYRDVLTVISITQDEEAGWKKYSAEHGVGGVNLRDPESLAGLSVHYGVKGIPHYVLISPEGKVMTSWTGYASGWIENKLDEMLPDSVGRPYLIEGRVTGVAAGAVFFLMDLDFEGGSSIARDTLHDGTFRFTGSVEAPVKIGLSSQAISTMLKCWIGPGATTAITGEGPFPAAWKIESDLPEQTESNRYDEVSREMSLLRQQCHAEFMSIYNKLDLSKDSVPPRLFALQTSRDSAARIAASRELELLAVSPVSTVWMDRFVGQVQRFSSSSQYPGRDTVLTLYDRLGDGWKQSEAGRYIALKLFPPKAVEIGDEFADGELFDTTGAVRYLADFRSEGKYMVLDFWHSACRACLEAIPEMNEVGEQYKDKLVIVGITLDRSPEVWKRTLAGHRVSWPGLRTAEGKVGLAAKYRVNGTPRYVMISPEGRVVALWGGYGPGTFRKEVEKVLQPADMR